MTAYASDLDSIALLMCLAAASVHPTIPCLIAYCDNFVADADRFYLQLPLWYSMLCSRQERSPLNSATIDAHNTERSRAHSNQHGEAKWMLLLTAMIDD